VPSETSAFCPAISRWTSTALRAASTALGIRKETHHLNPAGFLVEPSALRFLESLGLMIDRRVVRVEWIL
jgi:hypothetical protein